MKRHILVIDNEPYFRHIVAFMLRNAGYRVSSAATPDNARALLTAAQGKRKQYDLLFVDTHLPGMSIQQLADDLKAQNISVPILTVGGFTDKSFVIELLNSGHNEFLENIFADSDMNRQIERTMTANKNGGKPAQPTTARRAAAGTKKTAAKKKN